MSEIMPRDVIRIGTAERERAARDLGEHFAAGRLDETEFDERVGRVYLARTAGDLAPVFADLPHQSANRPVPTARRRPPIRPLVIALLALGAIAWTAIVRIPPFFVFPLFWFAFARPMHHHRRHWAERY